MPRRDNQRMDLDPPDQTATGPVKTLGPTAAALTSEQRKRWADLVATGEAAFPDNLLEVDNEALCREVRQRRRDRLIRFVACAIAREIWRELQTKKE
jgi:hypothetical protein